MILEGNLRKMTTWLEEQACYALPLHDILEPMTPLPMNELIGREVAITFNGKINCVVSGKQIKKAFGEGMAYDVWQKSPLAVESIIRPELSRIHEGIALRDKEWEEKYHNRPHYVYLSRTSGIKVGVTSTGNVPSRWIDQGAVEALVIAETPYRQMAGLIEVRLAKEIPDKTLWRDMLTGKTGDGNPLTEARDKLFEYLEEDARPFLRNAEETVKIMYPLLKTPEKVTAIKLDSVQQISGKLIGIKGQYLLFESGLVINIRSHSGYRVSIEY